MDEKGYIDDEQFTEAFIEERVKHKKIGLNKVRNELYSKGVSKEIIENKLFFDDEVLQKNALNLAVKKLRIIRSSSKKTEKQKVKQKIYSHLLMRGYDSQIIKNVFELIDFDE